MLTLLAQIPLVDDRREIARDLRLTAESAAQAGIRVYSLPLDLDAAPAQDLLAYLRAGSGYTLFSGYIMSEGKAGELEEAVRSRGYRPVNSAEETFLALRFQSFYPLIRDLTAESAVCFDQDEALRAAEMLGLPLFVKRDIKSAKEAGWDACTINDPSQLQRLSEGHFPLVLRRILPLRRSGELRNGFPVSREYRFYLYRGSLIGGGFYWSDVDPFGPLSGVEREETERLAQEAASRITTPLIACDVGQLEDGSWRVIEIGDVQFSGVAHMPRAVFWERLLAFL